ncbi:MAG: alpha-xylosidase [Hadesarchaea archaeon]|nr:alpha-xylosidase [Hadesarchaea archaeon]
MFTDDLFERDQRKIEYVKRILKWERQGDSISFVCETSEKGVVRLRLDLCAEDVFRFRMVAQGDVLDNRTLMILKSKLGNLRFELKEEKDSLSIKTSKLGINIDKDPWRLLVYDAKGKIICQEFSTKDVGIMYPLGFSIGKDSGGINVFETISLSPDEHIFGLGEKFSSLDKKERRIISWTTDALGTSTPRTYKNIPFFMSTRGYGIFVNSSHEIVYDFGEQSHSSYTFLIKNGILDYFFIYGPLFKHILDKYTDLTGKAPVPPKWSFGLWMSKASYRNRAELEEVCKKLREYDIPCDVIHLDPAWLKGNGGPSHLCDLEWNEETFPNPKEMITRLKEAGFKLSLWINPYVPKGSSMFEEGKRGGFFPVIKGGSLYDAPLEEWGNAFFKDKAVVDFSNPGAIEWFKSKLRKLLELGVAVFKTDFGESAPQDAVYHNGMEGKEMHNLYPLLYNKTVFECTEEFYGKGLVWARSGYAGMQRYPVCWAGDSASQYSALAHTLRGGLSLGLSGVPFWSHDVGGYCGELTLELYVRWAQLGFFSSHVRCHGTTPREPWRFGEEALYIFRRYAKLRYRLLPYIYSCAHISSQTGSPMMRAMVFEYQDDPNCHDKDLQYMFGEFFLVAPVFDESGERSVYLPEGRWVDYWTKEEFEGPVNITYRARLDTLPLFVKANSIIPMGPEMAYVDEKPFDPITLDIYCQTYAKFTLHDDAGTTIFECTREPGRMVLKISQSKRNYVLMFNLVRSAKKVIINGNELARCSVEEFEKADEGWYLDPSGKVMVKFAARGTVTTVIEMG